jgi:hypothetical protein
VDTQSGARDRVPASRRARAASGPGERTAKRKTNRAQNAVTLMKKILNVREDKSRNERKFNDWLEKKYDGKAEMLCLIFRE